MNVLFICSKNQWRSPTAESIYARQQDLAVRSRGTASAARRQVAISDVQWADMILVMEQKHSQRLRAAFPKAMEHKAIHVLDIPDLYQYMDDELIDLLRSAVDPLIGSAE